MLIPLFLALILAAETYAWFYQGMDMATLMSVEEPAEISILGPGGSNTTALDLSYTDANKDADNKVTIQRVICVQSAAEAHRLEIVHTTNLKGLEFKLYPATEIKNPQGSASGTVTDGGFTYSYEKNGAVKGNYINVESGSNAGYKYAENTYHGTNYNNYENVQAHAEPVYWLSEDGLAADKGNDVSINEKTNHRTYYVCEISWTETTEKETDIFYILAKTATKTTGQ